MSWPSMYAISGASGESLALETGLSVNVRFGSPAAMQTDSSLVTALGCEEDSLPGATALLNLTPYQLNSSSPNQ